MEIRYVPTNRFADLMPDQRLDLRSLRSGPAKTAAIEDAYKSGFSGAFLTQDDGPMGRAARWYRDEFRDSVGVNQCRFSDLSFAGPASADTQYGYCASVDAFRTFRRDKAADSVDWLFKTAQNRGSCFPPGTLIQMADGTQRRIENVRLRENVVTAEGNVGTVRQLMVRDVDEAIYCVKLWGHFGLKLTSEHPILTARGYVQAREILIGDEVAIPKYHVQDERTIIQTAEHCASLHGSWSRQFQKKKHFHRVWGHDNEQVKIQVCHQVPDMIELDDRFGRLTGLFLAEGNCDVRKVVWTFALAEENTLAAETVDLIHDLFGIEASVSKPTKGSSIKVTLHSRPFAELFRSLCGDGAANKRLHPDLASAPLAFQKAMFYGWAAGDGHERRESLLQIVTVSKDLAFGMYAIANRLGLRPSLRSTEQHPSGNVKSRRRRYDLTVPIAVEMVPQRGCVWQVRQDSSYMWRKVRGIEQEHYSGPVYNMSVSGDESYVADCVGVHNCVGASGVEMLHGMLGTRAADPANQEAFKYLMAWWQYAFRGSCGSGWYMGAYASVTLEHGYAFAFPKLLSYVYGGEDDSEQLCDVKWCRSGPPADVQQFVKEQGWAFEPGAITEFDGGVEALKVLSQQQGQFHHGSNVTSGSHKPDTLTTIGGHAQTCYAVSWHPLVLDFYSRKGYTLAAGDAWTANHQSWGSGWSGEIADDLYPFGYDGQNRVYSWAEAKAMPQAERDSLTPLWGEKPEGAWVCSASKLLKYVEGYAYLPKFKGLPADGPQPPPEPGITLTGELFTETGQPIRGSVVASGTGTAEFIAVPTGMGKYAFVRKQN